MMKEVDVDEPCTARDLKLAPVAIFETCYLSKCQETNDLGLCFEICHLCSKPDTNDPSHFWEDQRPRPQL